MLGFADEMWRVSFRKFEKRKGWVSQVECEESLREKGKSFRKFKRKCWVSRMECGEFVRGKLKPSVEVACDGR